MLLEASCTGTYTVTASVIANGSGCTMATSVGRGNLPDTRFFARLPMGNWIAHNACAEEALTESGGITCLTVSWTATGGGTGSADLGCFAPFGPYCFRKCGPGGGGTTYVPTGVDGEWEF